jgi:hypothetical protein
VSDRRSIARDLAAIGCGCDEDMAGHCVHMQDGCCTHTAFWIEKALDDACAAGMKAAMRNERIAQTILSAIGTQEDSTSE